MSRKLIVLALVGWLLALGGRGAAHANRSDLRWVLLTGGQTSMSGSTQLLAEARRQRKGDEDLLYVRRAGASWVIRDAETIARVIGLFEPQVALGEKQAQLGVKQAALGAKQGALGGKQARIAGRMTRAADERTRDELAAELERLAAEQQALAAQQVPLAAEQSRLGAQQEALARRAEARMPQLVDAAIARKLAVPAT